MPRLTSALQVLGHGVGGRQDLPLPFGLAVGGAVVVLVASFALLGLLWRTPRLRGAEGGRPLPAWLATAADATATRVLLRLLGLVALLYVGFAAVVGPADGLAGAANPTPYVVYVLLWVGLVPLSLLLGPVVRLLNPLRTLHAGLAWVFRVDPGGVLPLPARLGWWPAAAGLAAFTWLELVAPDRDDTSVLRLVLLVYGALQLVLALVYGRDWFTRGELFEAYSDLVGRLAPVGRRGDGRLVLRNPLDGLATLGPEPGLVATTTVLLGSTAFDSVSGTTWWTDAVQASAVPELVWGTAGLAAAVGLVAGAYLLGSPVARLEAGEGPEPRQVPGLFAHSLVPIVVGYVAAHYFSLLVLEGWRAFLLLNDPLGRGDDVFGLGGGSVDYGVLGAGTIAVVQVVAIVVGHVVGVVAAHDRAVAVFPPAVALRAQLPLLGLMVLLTYGGISLLLA